MAERQIAVPTAGTVVAAPTFRVIASMNPYDNVGTTRLSTSVHDRICRLAIGYQDAAAERGIVALRAPLPKLAADLYDRLVGDAVAVTRATREHPDIRQGSSVRGAIDLTLVAGQLLACAGSPASPDEGYPDVVYDAMVVALSGPDLPGRDGRGNPGSGAAADLGGPVHPGPGRGGARLKSSSDRLAAAPSRWTTEPPGHAAAPPAEAARRGTAAA